MRGKIKKHFAIFIIILIAIIATVSAIIIKNRKIETTQISDNLDKAEENLWYGSYGTYSAHGPIFLFGYWDERIWLVYATRS